MVQVLVYVVLDMVVVVIEVLLQQREVVEIMNDYFDGICTAAY